MVVYDVHNSKSLANARTIWIESARNRAPSYALVLLVGNKADELCIQDVEERLVGDFNQDDFSNAVKQVAMERYLVVREAEVRQISKKERVLIQDSHV